MIEIAETGGTTQRAIAVGNGFEMRRDRIDGQLTGAVNCVLERARDEIGRPLPTGQASQRRIEMQGPAQQDVAGPLARVLGVDEAEMDLALVPQAGLCDRLGRLIVEIDLASVCREREGRASALDTGAEYRNCLSDRTPPNAQCE